MNKQIAVLLVVTNEADHLHCFFESLKNQTYRKIKVYVIDNDSKDNSSELVQFLYPEAFIIRQKENVGFAKGNNIAADVALKDGADYVFILNPDIELHPRCIEELLVLAESDPKIGAVGPIMFFGLEEKGEKRIQSYADIVKFRTGNTYSFHANQYFIEASLPPVVQVNMISGGIIFLKKELFNQIGLFEERYFIYNEEVDFAYRVARTEYKMFVTHRAQVWHHHNWGKNNSKKNHFMYYYIMRNKFLFFRKYKLYRFFLLNLMNELFLVPLKIRWALKQSDKHLLNYYYSGLIDGIAGKTGKANKSFN